MFRFPKQKGRVSPEGKDDVFADEVEHPGPSTIAEVMASARQRIAELVGVRVEAVKLDLRIEY